MGHRNRESLTIYARVKATASPSAFIELVADLDRYVATEPRLLNATWLTGSAPGEGAVALLETDIPFTVPLVRRLLKRSTTRATMTRWRPPDEAELAIEGRSYVGGVAVHLEEMSGVTYVIITGSIVATSLPLALVIRSIPRYLERLAQRAVVHGVERADEALLGSPTPRLAP
jgi:hypothetical protein